MVSKSSNEGQAPRNRSGVWPTCIELSIVHTLPRKENHAAFSTAANIENITAVCDTSGTSISDDRCVTDTGKNQQKAGVSSENCSIMTYDHDDTYCKLNDILPFSISSCKVFFVEIVIKEILIAGAYEIHEIIND